MATLPPYSTSLLTSETGYPWDPVADKNIPSKADYYRQRFPNLFQDPSISNWQWGGEDKSNIIAGPRERHVYGFFGDLPSVYNNPDLTPEDLYNPYHKYGVFGKYGDPFGMDASWKRIPTFEGNQLKNDYRMWKYLEGQQNIYGTSPEVKAQYKKYAEAFAGDNQELFKREKIRETADYDRMMGYKDSDAIQAYYDMMNQPTPTQGMAGTQAGPSPEDETIQALPGTQAGPPTAQEALSPRTTIMGEQITPQLPTQGMAGTQAGPPPTQESERDRYKRAWDAIVPGPRNISNVESALERYKVYDKATQGPWSSDPENTAKMTSIFGHAPGYMLNQAAPQTTPMGEQITPQLPTQALPGTQAGPPPVSERLRRLTDPNLQEGLPGTQSGAPVFASERLRAMADPNVGGSSRFSELLQRGKEGLGQLGQIPKNIIYNEALVNKAKENMPQAQRDKLSHAIYSYKLAQSLGPTAAKIIGYGKEGLDYLSQPTGYSQADLAANKLGIELAQQRVPSNQLISELRDATPEILNPTTETAPTIKRDLGRFFKQQEIAQTLAPQMTGTGRIFDMYRAALGGAGARGLR
tara:strand:+ start:6041 stop:7783 length:1743 start_codon:yes stop_codon:yes gene_type:complete